MAAVYARPGRRQEIWRRPNGADRRQTPRRLTWVKAAAESAG